MGSNPDLDIVSALQLLDQEHLKYGYVLISVIDSTPRVRELPSLVPLLEKHNVFHQAVDNDVLIKAEGLELLIEEGFFTGFDELALLEDKPRSGKPEGLRVTSDSQVFPPPSLDVWMREASAVTVLGDGVGLNYATFDPMLAAKWKAAVS